MADSATWLPWVLTGSTEFCDLYVWEDGSEIVGEVEFVRGGSVERRVYRFRSITEAREWCEQTAAAPRSEWVYIPIPMGYWRRRLSGRAALSLATARGPRVTTQESIMHHHTYHTDDTYTQDQKIDRDRRAKWQAYRLKHGMAEDAPFIGKDPWVECYEEMLDAMERGE